MTSKEALEHIIKRDYNLIICTIPPQQAYNGLTQKDMIDIVKKDLEVLEILKKYTTIQQNTHNVWFDNEYFINGKKCSEEEYETVRESLENGFNI